jgi:S1-C subfamily serine protease
LAIAMKSLDDVYDLARAFNGIPVLGCMDGSPAHRAGIRYGDIVVQMNGMPTPDVGAYARAQDTDAIRVPISVVRDGVTLELVLEYAASRTPRPRAVAEAVVEARIFAPSRPARVRGEA